MLHEMSMVSPEVFQKYKFGTNKIKSLKKKRGTFDEEIAAAK